MEASGRLWRSVKGRKRAVQATCSVIALRKHPHGEEKHHHTFVTKTAKACEEAI